MGERRENYLAKIEEKRRRRDHFARFFWLVVAVVILGAFVESRGWKPNSLQFMILGVGIAPWAGRGDCA